MKRVGSLIVCVGLLGPASAHAQIPVTDALSLTQLIRTAVLTGQTIRLMEEEYQTLQRLARGYGGNLGRYRVPAIPTANHDVSRWLYAGPLLQGLNTGDPRGERYTQVMRQVVRPGGLFEQLSPEARRIMEVAFAGIEIADSTATLGVHQAAMSRGYGEEIARLIRALEADVTNPGSEYHEATAIADKLALASLINARQNQSSNQVESSILEQLLAKNGRSRNAAAAQSNMTITVLRDGGDVSRPVVANATSALQNWRLP